MSESVSITVDGKEIQAPKGALLIEHLLKNDIEIPHFCYHPSLGNDGNCRMCMVEIEGSKRPQIACDTPIKDGMSIKTKGEKIEKVRRDILELEMLNHPVDCPICDKAGECKLQDYYMDGGLYEARIDANEKNHAKKKVSIGKDIVLDQERCVLCTRCVRFTKNITKTDELGVINRGDHSVIDTFGDGGMESEYSMNVVDLCPVGALTNRDFRFKQRVWFLETFKAICNGCSRGCNILVDHNKLKYEDDMIFRFRPDVNLDVNGYFMCDYGRLSYKNENENRAVVAKIERVETEIAQAIDLLHELVDSNQDNMLILVSGELSNEELKLMQDYASGVGANISGYSPQYFDEEFADDMLKQADRCPNRAGMQKLGISEDAKEFEKYLSESSVVMIIENNYFDSCMDMLNDKKVISLLSSQSNLMDASSVFVPIASFMEKSGTYVNCDGIEQKVISKMKKNIKPKVLRDIFEVSRWS